MAHGSGDILDGITTYSTLAEALHDVDFTVATTARSRARFHYYATPQQLLPLLEEKANWMTHTALVFGREDAGLTNEELARRCADRRADGRGLSFAKPRSVGDGLLLSISIAYATTGAHRRRGRPSSAAGVAPARPALLSRLGVEDDAKLADWLSQRMGLLQQRDTAMLHRLLHDIEKPSRIKLCHIF